MVNKLVTKALRVLAKNPSIVDLPSFWDAVGRPDLRDVSAARELLCAPAISSMLYEAKREIARRIEAAKPKAMVKLDDGTEVEVRRADRTKPKPVTEFILEEGIEIGGVRKRFGVLSRATEFVPTGPARHYWLNPTKGWRHTRLDAAERDRMIERGVPLFREWPEGRVRRAA